MLILSHPKAIVSNPPGSSAWLIDELAMSFVVPD